MFYEQNPNETVPAFQEILSSINYSVVKSRNQPWKINYKFRKSGGSTEIRLFNQYDENKPGVIFHHGLGAMTFIIQIQMIKEVFPQKKYNLFVIRASHHDIYGNVVKHFINNFVNFASGIAGSTLAVEEAVNFHKSLSQKPVIVTGFSLGGMVTGLHYFYFGNADYYFPIISFPDA